MQKRKYEISSVPLSLSLGLPAHCIDFIEDDGAVIPLEVAGNELEAKALGEAWVSGHDVTRQIMDGVTSKAILEGLDSSKDPE